VTHKEFTGVDHGFTHFKPFDVARESVRMIGEHLREAYDRVGSSSRESRNE
jgi:acetyl esterase